MILRSLPHESSKIFLTFDDGPDAFSTPRILDLLALKRVHATFFLIGSKIGPARELVARMRREGHALGNHSSDHRYSNYFRGVAHMKNWLRESEAEFSAQGLDEVVGFRPPAGIVTRHLKRAAEEAGVPLILWNERFYDAVWAWGKFRARRSAATLKGGSIVLLHDLQFPDRLENFLKVLDFYIDALRARGFEFARLTEAHTMANSLAVSSKFTSQTETVPR